MPLTAEQKTWYYEQILKVDPDCSVVRGDPLADQVHYYQSIKSDKSHTRNSTPEELVHALAIALLVKRYGYPAEAIYHEKKIPHGSSGSSSDEIDLVIEDSDGLPFAVWEFKSSEDYESEHERATQYQLFGTVPLLTSGSPRHIVCATIDPTSGEPAIKLRCIDYGQVKDYAKWVSQGRPFLTEFPKGYRDPDFVPYIRGGEKDLRENCTLAEFRAVATQFHNEFFSEHPDNQLFESLVKLLLAKISSEKNTERGHEYAFQVFHKNGKPETAKQVFDRISKLYDQAYSRYIDHRGANPLDSNTFSAERVKSVVLALQGMALTRGSALSADIMGAFFEEILRAGFKQDRGMYFTHDNISRFMAEAVGLRALTAEKWCKATHPNNRLPYVIDPACGSGSFLLHAMQLITQTIVKNHDRLVTTDDATAFFNQNLSDIAPNAWAKDFLYGFDYKFIMALTAKVNMVLHGDGVTHIFKDDAYKPLSTYAAEKFRPVNEIGAGRSLSVAQYPKPMCETFDVVMSNPPFGVTLSPETQSQLGSAFTLSSSSSTEALFIERSFQLLRPHGRLAVVLPESVLNASENIETRKFLYRLFYIRAVVLLPRNIFVDTPTLTSLLFAQKKPTADVDAWDRAWEHASAQADALIATARSFTKAQFVRSAGSASEVEEGVLTALTGIVDASSWVTKSGANARVLTFSLPSEILTPEDAANYYKDILFGAGFDAIVGRYILQQVAESLNYDWASYTVSEVGFKLSKRRERARENQLMQLRGVRTGQTIQNLHLAEEPAEVIVDIKSPSKILDFIASDVVWSSE